MPKQYFEISKFVYGIVGKPQDSRDIPPDAASNSLNVEPLTKGEIQGIPDDRFLKRSGFVNTVSSVYYKQGGATSGTSGGASSGSHNIDPPS